MRKRLLLSEKDWLDIKNYRRDPWDDVFDDSSRGGEDDDDWKSWPEINPLSYPCVVIYEQVMDTCYYGDPSYVWHWRFVYPSDFV